MPVDHRADAVRILGRNAPYPQVAALAQKRRSLAVLLAKRPAREVASPQLAPALRTRSTGGPPSTNYGGFGTSPFGLAPFST